MAEIIADCPRCGAQHSTLDLTSSVRIGDRHGWQGVHEAFCVCRHCSRSSIHLIVDKDVKFAELASHKGLEALGAITSYVDVQGHLSLKDERRADPPEHLPDEIRSVFEEGATCLAVNCFNAAGTMFRLCVDLATKSLLPDPQDSSATQPSSKERRELGLRLPWLFDKNLLDQNLRDLSICIKDDGNDGAHAGTLLKEDAEDIMDFTFELLEQLYTNPMRIELANLRRQNRRNPSKN
ncbi:MAG TPA: DUF4145 domain-containing protein [Rhodocyclaceae bacterium]|jgi:hypothetical protein